MLDAARDKRLTLYTSGVLLDELAEVLSRRHLASVIAENHTSPAFLMQRYGMLAQIVSPAQTARVVARDIDDDAVIAGALAGKPIGSSPVTRICSISSTTRACASSMRPRRCGPSRNKR